MLPSLSEVHHACYEVVVLDVDDTLVRTGIDWRRIRAEIAKVLGFEVPKTPLAEFLSGVSGSVDARKLATVLEIVHNEEMKSVDRIESNEALKELMSELKNLGLKISVITLRSKDTTVMILKKLNILEFIDLIVTREDVSQRLEQLKLVLKFFKVPPHAIVFFGDHETDLIAGQTLNVKTELIPKNPNSLGVPEELLIKLRSLVEHHKLFCRNSGLPS
ncbi:MAG: hypothetical protein B7O98_01825 [Zestosphaera tikiterensis]|uniref:HAD family hydrolase n=1 Tax=Zestosphaera tikiterensis TaxID=1973259 RepID=A0A2R7Y6Q2_9CREN|nr:MAG: hypothetical protein B7O98_01825 [Zestosphaera tikiterensis]